MLPGSFDQVGCAFEQRLGLGPGRHFAKHLARPVFPQRRRLSGDDLAVG
jgi:hypothetical protein